MPNSPRLHEPITGLVAFPDRGRPPHPGDKPCGSLCVPACTITDDSDCDNESLTIIHGVRP